MMGVPTYPGRRKPTNDNQLLTAVNSSNNIESMVIILHLLASSILSCMYVPTLDAQRPEMIYTLFPKITLELKNVEKSSIFTHFLKEGEVQEMSKNRWFFNVF